MNGALKRGSLSGLLYREFYMARKDFITAVFLFLGTAVMCLMILLSFDHGNLGKMADLAFGAVRKEAEWYAAEGNYEPLQELDAKIASMRQSLMIMVEMLPVIMGCEFALGLNNVVARDELVSWRRFAGCTPVTPQRRALVRTLMNGICCLASMLLAFVYISIVGAVSGTAIEYREYAVVFCIITAVTAFAIAAQIFIMIFRSADKGYIALLVMIIVPSLTAGLLNGDRGETEINIGDVAEFCSAVMPFLPLIILGILSAGFAASYLHYRRREK